MMVKIYGVIRTICLGFLVALLCVSLTCSLDYSKVEEEEAFFNQLVDPVTGEIDEILVKLIALFLYFTLMFIDLFIENYALIFYC